jgi:hypothetical protein
MCTHALAIATRARATPAATLNRSKVYLFCLFYFFGAIGPVGTCCRESLAGLRMGEVVGALKAELAEERRRTLEVCDCLFLSPLDSVFCSLSPCPRLVATVVLTVGRVPYI